jgi:glutamyl-tRNA reductase
MIVTAPDETTPAVATVVALVAHARSVPSVRREAFADELRAMPEDRTRLVIRTCHRVEVYAVRASLDAAPLPEVPPGGEQLQDVDAVEHLITAACGLDSAVFGETQILHQLRETIEDRHHGRALDPVLDRLFQVALRAGREARTYVTGSPRSLADVALDRIAAVAGPLAGRPILIVGVGRMGRLAAVAANRRGAHVVIANRTESRATALAAEVGGTVTPFDLDGRLGPVGGVILAIGGHWPIGPSDLGSLHGSGAPIVDLSSPPALAPDAPLVLADHLISVDDLAEIDDGSGPSARVRGQLGRVVSRAGAEYCQWLRSRYAVPAISAVVSASEERRRTELEWLRRRLPDLSAEELAVVEQMSHRLVAGILHAPLTALKADDAGELEPVARELFGV